MVGVLGEAGRMPLDALQQPISQHDIGAAHRGQGVEGDQRLRARAYAHLAR
jgi:hypothetical protein